MSDQEDRRDDGIKLGQTNSLQSKERAGACGGAIAIKAEALVLKTVHEMEIMLMEQPARADRLEGESGTNTRLISIDK